MSFPFMITAVVNFFLNEILPAHQVCCNILSHGFVSTKYEDLEKYDKTNIAEFWGVITAEVECPLHRTSSNFNFSNLL